MADFSLAQIGEGATASPQPQPGVQQPSAIQAGVQFAAGIGSSLFESFAAADEAEDQEAVNKAVSRFSRQQMQFAEWVDQGEFSSQEGRMRMRNNLVRAMADNPNLSEAFSKAHESIIETAGMGKVAATGTEQEQQILKVQQEARDNGFITPGMSPEQEQQRTFEWMELQQARLKRELAKEELSFQQAQVSLQRGRIGLQSDQLSLQTARQEKAIQDATLEGSRAYFPVFAERMQGIVAGVQAGELDPVAADLQMRQLRDQVEGELRQGGATMSQSTLDNILTPYDNMFETASGVISGQHGAEVMQSQRDNAIARTELSILADDNTRALVATSNLLGASAGPLLQLHGAEVARGAINIYKNNDRAEGARQNPMAAEPGELPAYLTIMNTGLKEVNRTTETNQNTDLLRNELNRQIDGITASIAKYGPGENFNEVKPMLDFIASDDYANYMTTKGRGGVNKQNEAAVKDYAQTFFLDEIQPLIAEEWRNATTELSAKRMGPGPEGRTEEAPTSELIKPTFTGDGVMFVKTNQAEDNPRIDREVKRLNEKVSPALNMFIRLGAHLEEHTNYKQIYEANYANIFGDAGTGPQGE